MRSTAPFARSAGYLGLREQATQMLADAPDGITESDLAQALFGAGRGVGASTGGRWVVLLQAVLGDDARLTQEGGRWYRSRPVGRAMAAMATHEQVGPPAAAEPEARPGAILTLALATTGADPRRHRIARIGIVRREDGDVTARLDVVVSTRQRLSRYLLESAPIAADDLDDAPSFAEIVPPLRELVEGQHVYVYGARRAQAFLNAELARAELPGLDASLVEIDDALRALLPGTRKPGLLAAATELGIPPPRAGSALSEAEVASRLIERLRERQAASPARAAVSVTASDPDHLADAGAPLPFTQSWLAGVPDGPGVYVIEDAAGSTLYVGKAGALRKRLAAYVSRLPSLHRQMEALGVRAAAVNTVETRSDLEATLLEARLIRQRQPEFNVARQIRPPTTLVRAAPDDPTPRLRLVSVAADDGARYFGPFETTSAARQALEVIRLVFPEALARRRGEPELQRTAVLDACRLLSGQKAPAVSLLQQRMCAAAEAGDPGEVDRLRRALRAVQALRVRPSLLAGRPTGWRLLVAERLTEGRSRAHVIEAGRLIGSANTDASTLPSEPTALRQLADWVVASTEAASSESGDPDPDEPAIVQRWLAQAAGRVTVLLVPPV